MVDTVSLTIGVFLIILGLILFGLELAHPGAFLLIPGTIAITAGILYLAFPDWLLGTIYGPAAVALVAVLVTLLTIPYYQRLAPTHPPLSTTPRGLAGEIGLVLTPVKPDSLQGKVRVRSEVWSARSDVAIPAGVKVRITGGEGVSVFVQPLESGSA